MKKNLLNFANSLLSVDSKNGLEEKFNNSMLSKVELSKAVGGGDPCLTQTSTSYTQGTAVAVPYNPPYTNGGISSTPDNWGDNTSDCGVSGTY